MPEFLMVRWPDIYDIWADRVGGHLVGGKMAVDRKQAKWAPTQLLFESEHLLIIYLTNLA